MRDIVRRDKINNDGYLQTGDNSFLQINVYSEKKTVDTIKLVVSENIDIRTILSLDANHRYI